MGLAFLRHLEPREPVEFRQEVLVGALLNTGLLPLELRHVQEAIQTRTKAAFVDTNLKAVDLGWQAAAEAVTTT